MKSINNRLIGLERQVEGIDKNEIEDLKDRVRILEELIENKIGINVPKI